jgi:tRNA C32,U32 (ribose-2'-O)-methylase TrmJ
VGNEGKGLRNHIAKQCDAFIQIPNVNAEESVVESLNVSVATGIVLAKLMNGRFMNMPKNLKMYPHRIHVHKTRKSRDDDDSDDEDDGDDEDDD